MVEGCILLLLVILNRVNAFKIRFKTDELISKSCGLPPGIERFY